MLLKRKNDLILICYRTDGEAKFASRRLLPLAVDAFCRQLGEQEKKVLFDERGKPYFEDFAPYHLSLSHAGDYLVFAFAPRPVGVDCERETEDRPRVAHRYFSPEEKKMPFALVWTAREAVGKLTGVGLSDALQTRVLKEKATLNGDFYSLDTLSLEGFRITVAQKED